MSTFQPAALLLCCCCMCSLSSPLLESAVVQEVWSTTPRWCSVARRCENRRGMLSWHHIPQLPRSKYLHVVNPKKKPPNNWILIRWDASLVWPWHKCWESIKAAGRTGQMEGLSPLFWERLWLYKHSLAETNKNIFCGECCLHWACSQLPDMQISPHAAGLELCSWQSFCTNFGNSFLRDWGMTKQKGMSGDSLFLKLSRNMNVLAWQKPALCIKKIKRSGRLMSDIIDSLGNAHRQGMKTMCNWDNWLPTALHSPVAAWVPQHADYTQLTGPSNEARAAKCSSGCFWAVFNPSALWQEPGSQNGWG